MSATPPPVDPAIRPYADEAVADLSRRLGVERDEIDVIEARTVVWPDGSLGCPQPGMMYPQVMVDGVLVRLSARGRIFAYHGGGSRRIFLCENARGA